MHRLVDFRGGSVCLVERDHVFIAAADPPVSPEVAAARLPVGEGLAGRVAATGEPIYSPDLDADDRVVPELRRLGSNQGITSYLAVPLVCLGRVIGLLQVDSPERDAYDDIDRTLLEGLASQMASAIESVRHFDEVMKLEGLKGGILNMLSHELRTPLAIASGFVQLLVDHRDELTDDDVASMLSRTSAALSRLHALVEQVLTMSNLAGGQVPVTLAETTVTEVLEHVLLSAADRSLVEVADVDQHLVVTTDPELVWRMLAELVDNAVKYGGGAEVSSGRHDDRGGVVVRVRDHGPGLPEELRGRAFESFSRGAGDTTVAGLGLGLSVVAALAQLLDADVSLTTPDDGVGTEATVVLHGGGRRPRR
jgi:K+-sensing histidine kinase KdpD